MLLGTNQATFGKYYVFFILVPSGISLFLLLLIEFLSFISFWLHLRLWHHYELDKPKSLMMQRLTFPFPFVHHQTHDWLLSVLEFEGGLAIAETKGKTITSCSFFGSAFASQDCWADELILTFQCLPNGP